MSAPNKVIDLDGLQYYNGKIQAQFGQLGNLIGSKLSAPTNGGNAGDMLITTPAGVMWAPTKNSYDFRGDKTVAEINAMTNPGDGKGLGYVYNITDDGEIVNPSGYGNLTVVAGDDIICVKWSDGQGNITYVWNSFSGNTATEETLPEARTMFFGIANQTSAGVYVPLVSITLNTSLQGALTIPVHLNIQSYLYEVDYKVTIQQQSGTNNYFVYTIYEWDKGSATLNDGLYAVVNGPQVTIYMKLATNYNEGMKVTSKFDYFARGVVTYTRYTTDANDILDTEHDALITPSDYWDYDHEQPAPGRPSMNPFTEESYMTHAVINSTNADLNGKTVQEALEYIISQL